MFEATPSDAVGYVMAAYVFFLLILLVYLGILGAKLGRIGRDLTELSEEFEASETPLEGRPEGDRAGV